MRIGLDVMGGDHAPGAILDGALAALPRLDPDDQLVLVGDESIIRAGIARAGIDDPRLVVHGTTQVIAMDEPPVEAVRTKPDSSITTLARLAGRKSKQPLEAIISAGNTGAKVAAAQMHMRRLPSVHRPGIAVPVPTFAGPVVVIDVGANIAPKPTHLAQYGVMGATFASRLHGIENPRVGLMNIGGEEQKGTDDMKRARDMLRSVPELNFIGYVEGRRVFEGEADVVVTDGVVGNVMLKLAEGLSAGIFRVIARELAESDPELGARIEPVIRRIYARHDYHEFGGAPLLGVNGVCLICHGSSEARTIINAIVTAKKFIASDVNEAISARLARMEQAVAS